MDRSVPKAGGKGVTPSTPQREKPPVDDTLPQTRSGSPVPGKDISSRSASVSKPQASTVSTTDVADKILSMKDNVSKSELLYDFRMEIDNKHFDAIAALMEQHDFAKAYEVYEASLSLELEGNLQLSFMRDPMLNEMIRWFKAELENCVDPQSMNTAQLDKCMDILSSKKPFEADDLRSLAKQKGVRLKSESTDKNTASFDDVGILVARGKFDEAIKLLDMLVKQNHPSSHGLTMMRPIIEQMASN